MAILQHKNALVALVVPNPEAIRTRGASRLEALLREEIEHTTATLRPHERISGYALTTEALPRTHLGKLKRHLLPDIYEQAKSGKRQKSKAELSAEDKDLLARADTKPIWDWLVARYPDQGLTPETSPQLDLGVDSLQWIELTLELQEHFGVKLNEAAIGRILTIRDLLNEAMQSRSGEVAEPTEPAPDPMQWVQPIGIGHKLLGVMLYALDAALARLMFRLEIVGKEGLPTNGRIVLTPNHVSFLDPVLLAAAFSLRELQRTSWVGWSGIVLAGPLMRLVTRTAGILPIDPDRDPGAALSLVDKALETKNRLVWFPEGRRSPTGEITEFLPGIALVLERTGAKAVPVYISGTYEGDLTVRKHLCVRATGKLTGTVRYSQLELERGAQIANQRCYHVASPRSIRGAIGGSPTEPDRCCVDRLLPEREMARSLDEVLQEQIVGPLLAVAQLDLQPVEFQPRLAPDVDLRLGRLLALGRRIQINPQSKKL